LSEHYNDVNKLKRQYEIMKRAREAEFIEQIGVSPEVAFANLTSFTKKLMHIFRQRIRYRKGAEAPFDYAA
tara:strand:+ start:3612 stop:3824 length:213 start_codon:yes stop_codon:yes gene_type:complete